MHVKASKTGKWGVNIITCFNLEYKCFKCIINDYRCNIPCITIPYSI